MDEKMRRDSRAPHATQASLPLVRLPGDEPTRSQMATGARPLTDEVAHCCERIRAAMAMGERAERLAEARTTVAMRVRGRPAEGLTLLLEQRPTTVVSELRPAEVELELEPAHFAEFAAGRLSLQAAILDGEIGYRGPVRKLLSVSAVLLALLRDTAHGLTDDPRHTATATPTVTSNADGGSHRPPFAENAPGDFWAIECRQLFKSFGNSEVVLRGLELGIPEGLITVVLGPSGTGKSVLLKHLTGLLAPDSGEVLVRGEAVGRMSLKELLDLRRRIGILFQDGALWGSMNLYDNVALPLRQHTDLSEAQIADVVREMLGNVGLAGAEAKMPSELSGGMRKRAGFARALVLDPEIVLFDEPDSGLDPVRTALLCDLISRIHSDLGGTYLIVTHDIRTVRQVADYIVVLWQGGVVEGGPAEDVLSSMDPFVRQFLSAQTDGPLGMG